VKNFGFEVKRASSRISALAFRPADRYTLPNATGILLEVLTD
jgi:hypothetical protein